MYLGSSLTYFPLRNFSYKPDFSSWCRYCNLLIDASSVLITVWLVKPHEIWLRFWERKMFQHEFSWQWQSSHLMDLMFLLVTLNVTTTPRSNVTYTMKWRKFSWFYSSIKFWQANNLKGNSGVFQPKPDFLNFNSVKSHKTYYKTIKL